MKHISLLSRVARDLHCDVTAESGVRLTQRPSSAEAVDPILLILLTKTHTHTQREFSESKFPPSRSSHGSCLPGTVVLNKDRFSRTMQQDVYIPAPAETGDRMGAVLVAVVRECDSRFACLNLFT